MTCEVANAAPAAERDRHDRRLHRVAHGAHHRAELVGRVVRLEVDAPAHADLAGTTQHDRGFGVIRAHVVVGPAEEAPAPWRLVVRVGRDELAVAFGGGERPLEQKVAVAPEAWGGDAVERRRALGVVLPALDAAGGVADAESGQVELVRAVHAGIGHLRDGCAARRKLHALERPQVRGGVGTRAPGPPPGPGLDARHASSVVTERHLEMMEVVLERTLHDPEPRRGHPDPPPVRSAGVTHADDRCVAVAHALRFLPPGYPPPPNWASSAS